MRIKNYGDSFSNRYNRQHGGLAAVAAQRKKHHLRASIGGITAT